MYDLSIIIPVRNEARALPHVLKDLLYSLNGMNYQILLIDDGEDNTPQVIAQMHYSEKVKFVRRPRANRNGLAGAVILGLTMAENSTYVAVMDGDGQHPAEVVKRMYLMALQNEFDMVMASRYCKGGSGNGLDGVLRKFYSQVLRTLPRLFFPKRLADVTDPLAGLFLIRTECLSLDQLRAIGFKISLEVLLFSYIEKYGEVSYEFQERIGGKSKTNFRVGMNYFCQLLSLVARYYTRYTRGKHEEVINGYR